MATSVSLFRQYVSPHVPGCPIPLIDRSIVDSARYLCEQTDILEKTIGAYGTGSSVEDAEFPYVLPFTFGESSTSEYWLVSIDLSDYESLQNAELQKVISPFRIDLEDWIIKKVGIDNRVMEFDTFAPDDHKLYSYDHSNNVLKIFPFEESEDDIAITISLSVKPVDGATTIDDIFYKLHRRAVVMHAASTLQAMPKRPWTDPGLSEKNIAIAAGAISEINQSKMYHHFKRRISKKGFI